MNSVLAYVSAAMVGVWGVLHAAPTGRVLAGFEPATADNRRVIKQEWLAEAFAVLTALTGARTPVIWFKICPVLLSVAAVLLLIASL